MLCIMWSLAAPLASAYSVLVAMPPLPVVSAKMPPSVVECPLVGQYFAHLRDTAPEKCLTLRFGSWC